MPREVLVAITIAVAAAPQAGAQQINQSGDIYYRPSQEDGFASMSLGGLRPALCRLLTGENREPGLPPRMQHPGATA